MAGSPYHSPGLRSGGRTMTPTALDDGLDTDMALSADALARSDLEHRLEYSERERQVVSMEMRIKEEELIGARAEAERLRATIAALEQQLKPPRCDRACQTTSSSALPPLAFTPETQTYRRRFGSMAAGTGPSPSPQADPEASDTTGALEESGSMSQRRTSQRFELALNNAQQSTIGAGFASVALAGAASDLVASGSMDPLSARHASGMNSFRGVRSTPSGIVVTLSPRRINSARGDAADSSSVASFASPPMPNHGVPLALRRRRVVVDDTPREPTSGCGTAREGSVPPVRLPSRRDEDGGEPADPSTVGADAAAVLAAHEQWQRRHDTIRALCPDSDEALGGMCGVCYLSTKVMELQQDDVVGPLVDAVVHDGDPSIFEWLVSIMVHYADDNTHWLARDEHNVLVATVAALCVEGSHGGSAQWVDDGDFEAQCLHVDTVNLVVADEPDAPSFSLFAEGTTGAAFLPSHVAPQVTSRGPSPASGGVVPPIKLARASSTVGAAAAAGKTGGARPGQAPGHKTVKADVFQTPDLVLVFVAASSTGKSGSVEGDLDATGNSSPGDGAVDARRVLAVCSPRPCAIKCERAAGGGRFIIAAPDACRGGSRPIVAWPASATEDAAPFVSASLTFEASTRTVAKFKKQLLAVSQRCPHTATGVLRDGWRLTGRLLADHLSMRLRDESLGTTPRGGLGGTAPPQVSSGRSR